jgi:Ni/Co efflux regulator RcnB
MEPKEQWEKRTKKALLKAPKWETPKQWEKRTGKECLENMAVYTKKKYEDGWSRWYTGEYEGARASSYIRPTIIVIATEVGPPPDDWEPGTPEA